MTLKEFAKKYELEYYVVYNAMKRDNSLIEHCQNVDYEEKTIFDAVMRRYTKKEGEYLAKAKHYSNLKSELVRKSL